ncbi:MAG: hypothetical protein OEM52_08915 [bacterium]|nr:hypothetical protein [bacterium]
MKGRTMRKGLIIHLLAAIMIFAISTNSWCGDETFSHCKISITPQSFFTRLQMHEAIPFEITAYTYTVCDEATIDVEVERGVQVVEGETNWQGAINPGWKGVTRPLKLRFDNYGFHTITVKLTARRLHPKNDQYHQDVEACSTSFTSYFYARRLDKSDVDTLIMSSFMDHLEKNAQYWDIIEDSYRKSKVNVFRERYRNDPDSFRIMSRHYMYTKEQMRFIEQYKLLDSIPGKSFLECCVNNPIHQNKFSGGTDEQKANNIEAALRQFETLYEYDSKIIFEPSKRDSLFQNRQRLLNRLIFVPKEATPKVK